METGAESAEGCLRKRWGERGERRAKRWTVLRNPRLAISYRFYSGFVSQKAGEVKINK